MYAGVHCNMLRKFDYLGVIFTSNRRRNKEIDIRIGKVNTVLHKLYRSVVTKGQLSNKAKPSVFNLSFVLIVADGHEPWAMNKKYNPKCKSSRCDNW